MWVTGSSIIRHHLFLNVWCDREECDFLSLFFRKGQTLHVVCGRGWSPFGEIYNASLWLSLLLVNPCGEFFFFPFLVRTPTWLLQRLCECYYFYFLAGEFVKLYIPSPRGGVICGCGHFLIIWILMEYNLLQFTKKVSKIYTMDWFYKHFLYVFNNAVLKIFRIKC